MCILRGKRWSSLLSLLSLAALWMYMTRGSPYCRVSILAAVLPLVMIANTVRVTLVLLVGATLLIRTFVSLRDVQSDAEAS